MLTVVGIGDDGWGGLSDEARAELSGASLVIGAGRHLAMLPPELPVELLPSPLLPALWELVAEHPDAHLLASGDPMHFGLGATLARRLPVRVVPHVSSLSLACARLGWALPDVDVVSLVTAPVSTLARHLRPGARLLVLVRDGSTGPAVVELLATRGWSASTVTACEHLGGPEERLAPVEGRTADLCVLAVDLVADPGTEVWPLAPGLPERAFEHDGQITRREVRAVVVALLAPQPGQLLWDVGAGSGSVGIEWARAGGRTIAVEPRPDRAARVLENAHHLGVGDRVELLEGQAPWALGGLPEPDAVFVGGGLTEPGAFDACWQALDPGGRFVATAVTLESERLVQELHALHGGELTRLEVSRAEPLGSFTGWRPAMPIVVWSVTR